jgi:hypothetical protein
MAISAVDSALWDLKVRLLDLPLVRLLGVVREEVPAYGSGGFTSYSVEQLQEQLGRWAAEGFFMVKMKIGRHACCALAPVRHMEYFHDHVRIEHMFFDGAATAEGGMLHPDLTRPGLGLEFKPQDARAYETPF